jgi:hypothetical protein
MSYVYLAIGASPFNEEAYDAPANPELDRQVCWIFRAQLERAFPIPDGLPVRYRVATNQHDFGSYREVEVGYDEKDAEAAAYAYHVEANTPSAWDQEAREALIAWKLANGYGLSTTDLSLDSEQQSFGPQTVLLSGATGFVLSSDGSQLRISAHHDRASEIEERPPAPGIVMSTAAGIAQRAQRVNERLLPQARSWWRAIDRALERQTQDTAQQD